MKRVSRPTRMAWRQTTTQPRPSAIDESPSAWVPGIPISWEVTTSELSSMSSARSTVRGPSRNEPILSVWTIV